jgi:hypothetical protein
VALPDGRSRWFDSPAGNNYLNPVRINEAGILTLQHADLVPVVLSRTNWENLCHRGIITATRAHRGQPAEVAWHTLPERFQKAFIEKVGNPTEILKAQSLERFLKPDSQAREYYRLYIAGNHLQLPNGHIDLYSRQAQWLEVAISLTNAKKPELKKLGFDSKAAAYEALFQLPQYQATKLPTNTSKLSAKIRAFAPNYTTPGAARNYGALVSAKFGNNNSEKISAQQSEWLIAMYSNPALRYSVPRLFADYNKHASQHNWPILKSAIALHMWLQQPANKKCWYGSKYGNRKGEQLYSYVMRTAMPTMRDSLWYADGTKLNFHDAEGKLRAAYTVYEVIDAYSEVLLGFTIKLGHEDHTMQYEAFKMAMQVSGHRPYEVRYDNQGGHKKLKNNGFFDKLAHLNIPTKPYNGRSKSIESVFGRLQQQFMSREWFYTGQNITTRGESSQINEEFLVKNQRSLPTIEELIEIYKTIRQDWNNAKHPKLQKSRIQAYQDSQNDDAPALSVLDMVDIFWFTKPQPITYWNHGMVIEIKGRKYEYEVLTADGLPDMDFRRQYVQATFTVKYDPDDMSYIRLFEPGTMRFIAIAQPRLVVQRNIQEQKPEDKALIRTLLSINKAESQLPKLENEKLWEHYGILPDEIAANGGKQSAIRAENMAVSVGQLMKERSYADNEPTTGYLDKL